MQSPEWGDMNRTRTHVVPSGLFTLRGFVFHGFTPMATTCRHSVAKSPLAPLKVAYPEVVFQKQQTFDERAFLGPSGFVVGLLWVWQVLQDLKRRSGAMLHGFEVKSFS